MTEQSKGCLHRSVCLQGSPSSWLLGTWLGSLELSQDVLPERSRAMGTGPESRSHPAWGPLHAEHPTSPWLPNGTGFYFQKCWRWWRKAGPCCTSEGKLHDAGGRRAVPFPLTAAFRPLTCEPCPGGFFLLKQYQFVTPSSSHPQGSRVGTSVFSYSPRTRTLVPTARLFLDSTSCCHSK